MEEAPVAELFAAAKHPYTQGLLGALPNLGSSLTGEETRPAEIPGLVPSLKQRIDYCVFAGRCPRATDLCRKVGPALEPKAPNHTAVCHYAEKELMAARAPRSSPPPPPTAPSPTPPRPGGGCCRWTT